MKKVIVILLMICMVLPMVFAEEEETESNAFAQYPEALGFYYGEIAGTGLTYHRWNDGVGYQVTAGALYLPPDAGGNLLDYVVGFENSYTVYSEDFTNWLSGLLSLFWGVNHRGFIPVTYDEETYEPVIGSYTPTFTLGGGIGIEVLWFKHFSIPFEVGYGATYLPLESAAIDMFLVDLYFQAGFRYRY